MSNLAYVPLTDDLIADLAAADFVIETADADYPATELQTIPMGTTARATDPTGGERIKIDFGAEIDPKFWGLLNHDIESGNPLISSWNNADWTGLSETQAMTYRALDIKAYRAAGWTPKRYFDINFNACSFSQAFLEAGKLMVALDVTTFKYNFSPGVSRGRGSKNIHNVTPMGIEYTHLLQEKINYFGIKWDPDLKKDLLNELIAFIDITHGGGYPSIIIPDNDKAELFYMRNQDRTDWSEEFARSLRAKLNMKFKELSRGKVQEG